MLKKDIAYTSKLMKQAETGGNPDQSIMQQVESVSAKEYSNEQEEKKVQQKLARRRSSVCSAPSINMVIQSQQEVPKTPSVEESSAFTLPGIFTTP